MSPLYVPQILVPTNYLAPTGASYETFPRQGSISQAATSASGTLWMVAIQLPAGTPIGHICFASYTTAAVTPLHWWFGLYTSARVQLATTADQTTTAWAANTVKNLAVATTAAGAASSFTTTYTGLHYIGFMMAATTMCSLIGETQGNSMRDQAPAIWGGTTDTAQTTPPAFPHTAGAITASAVPVYAWVGA